MLINMFYCLSAVKMKLCLVWGELLLVLLWLVFCLGFFVGIKIKILSCLCDKFPKEICSDIESK